MRALILAAGYGTRLGELGRSTPKCLVQAGGVTMLEHVTFALKRAGVTDLVINLHHLPDKVREYVSAKNNFGFTVLEFSFEEQILGTGGAILQARRWLDGDQPFFVHNADVYSNFDLQMLYSAHQREQADASLLVMERETTRPLYFDSESALVGWKNAEGELSMLRSGIKWEALGFTGIQVISPSFFSVLERFSGKFSSISAYLSAAQSGQKILGHKLEDAAWYDVGTPEKLQELDLYLRQKAG